MTLGPNVAGTWYLADREDLARQIEGLLEQAPATPPAVPSSIAAVIAPHAGYVYSGAVAAAGFRHLVGATVERVLLLGPSPLRRVSRRCGTERERLPHAAG